MKYKFDEIAINCTKKKQPTDTDRKTYIGLEHIDPENFTISRWGSDITPTGEKLVMEKGDILFGKRRAYQRKVAIAPFNGIFSAHGMVLRPKTNVIDSAFFPFFIASDQFMETAVRISVGGLSPTINWKDLKTQEFEIPPLEEQKILADKLWAAYRLKEAYMHLLIATDEMVKSQFIEMFGNPLFSDEDDAIELREVTEIVLGSTPNSKNERYWNGNLCWITPSELSDDSFEVANTERHISEDGAKSANLTLMPKGTVLLSTRAPIGKVALTTCPMYCNQGFKNMICTDGINNVFLYYTLKYNKNRLQSMGTGTTFKELSKKIIESIKISVPPIQAQKEFESIYRQADKSKYYVQNKLNYICHILTKQIQLKRCS